MEAVRNSCDKLVCCIDRSKRIVEIVIKGCKTTITFLEDDEVKIVNARA